MDTNFRNNKKMEKQIVHDKIYFCDYNTKYINSIKDKNNNRYLKNKNIIIKNAKDQYISKDKLYNKKTELNNFLVNKDIKSQYYNKSKTKSDAKILRYKNKVFENIIGNKILNILLFSITAIFEKRKISGEFEYFKNKRKLRNVIQNKNIDKINSRIISTIMRCIIFFLCLMNFGKSFNKIQFNMSTITLKIKNPGKSAIYNQDFNPKPDKIILNGNDIGNQNEYNFIYSDNNIELIWNSNNPTNCKYLFKGCSNINEINLSGFSFSGIVDTAEMFWGCDSLTFIDLTDFDTSNVVSMEFMFYNCKSLTSIKLSSKFQTSNVYYMGFMFFGCSSLTSIDLSTFNTQQVLGMNHMFEGCSSLTLLDLSKFDVKQVTHMWSMFEGCLSLTSLDLSKFEFSENNIIDYIFKDCKNLKYLNIKKFKNVNPDKTEAEKVGFEGYKSIFQNVPTDIII